MVQSSRQVCLRRRTIYLTGRVWLLRTAIRILWVRQSMLSEWDTRNTYCTVDKTAETIRGRTSCMLADSPDATDNLDVPCSTYETSEDIKLFVAGNIEQENGIHK